MLRTGLLLTTSLVTAAGLLNAGPSASGHPAVDRGPARSEGRDADLARAAALPDPTRPGFWTTPDGSKTAPPQALVRTTGRTPVRVVSVHNVSGRPVIQVRVVAPGHAADAVSAIQQDPSLVAVTSDSRVEPMGVDDPEFPRQWALQGNVATGELDLRSTRAHGTGAGVIVAVVDSGVDGTHPDLQRAVLAGAVTAGTGITTGGGNVDVSDDGHGTHVAGIIAARTDNGRGIASVASSAKILPVRAIDPEGGWNSDIAEGIIWSADHGAKVINLSVAGTTYHSATAAAVSYAIGKGAIVVAAAGNTYRTGNPTTYPAAYPGVIGVGALDATGTHERASFSSVGKFVDLVAPGTRILSTVPGGKYGYLSGTSMATPHVSSVAALLTSATPTTFASARVEAMLVTATDKWLPGRDQASGYGAVNPVAALRRLRGAQSDDSSRPPVGAAPRVTMVVPSTVVYGARIKAFGMVTDSVTGLPVPAARLRIQVAAGRTTTATPVTADASGRYAFSTSMRRTVTMRAAFTGSARVLAGTTRWRTVTMVPSISTSRRRGTIRVQITPASRGTVLTLVRKNRGRWVLVSRTRTDAAGRASFRPKTAGTYRVRLG